MPQNNGLPASQREKLKRNWPSLAVDIGLGFIFFFVAKWTDLTTAALWGAAAGLALVVVQQFVKKVDLLGGLALFGIVMMLISAGYALVFQDEYLIQMRTTVIGGLGAVLYLLDGLFGGKYLGERTARYLFMPDIVPRRLSLALGGLSIIMAVLNWGVVKLVSKDVWLYYTTFGDFIVAMVVLSLAIKWVIVPGYDATLKNIKRPRLTLRSFAHYEDELSLWQSIIAAERRLTCQILSSPKNAAPLPSSH